MSGNLERVRTEQLDPISGIPQASASAFMGTAKPATGRMLYVDSQDYLDHSAFNPRFPSMQAAFEELQRGDTINLYGKIDESGLIGPDRNITDVTIQGMGTRTRPGHGGESAKAGGADWSNAKDNFTDPLLTIIAQGWSIQGIHFGGRIRLSQTVDWMQSASHAEFRNNAFSGGSIGIEDSGGCANVGIYGCQFYGFGKPGQTAIMSTSTAWAWPLMWEIVGNRFMNNDRHVVIPLSNSIVKGNTLFRVGYEGKINATAISLAGGKNNVVTHNNFVCLATDAVGAYIAGEGDAWGPNYCADKVLYGISL